MLRTTTWGLYLASSWTWCIGMFMPVVLLDRYGWGGVALFAIPNILGLVAFGYVVRTPQRSAELCAHHGRAMAAFSVVTIAFHVFFLAMVARWLAPSLGAKWSWMLPAAALVAAFALRALPTRAWPLLGTAVFLLSLAVGCTLLPANIEPLSSGPWQDLLWLAPIITFGFLLCPYLDATFHRALQEAPSRHAFAIFGAAFAVIIAITCLYADALVAGLATIVVVHLVAQSIFTIGAHLREAPRLASAKWTLTAVLVAATLGMMIAWRDHGDVAAVVDDYLRWIAFYGLIFPGIVAVFMHQRGSWTTGRTLGFTLLCVMAIPMLDAGFLRDQAWLTIPPIVVLVVWAFADRAKPTSLLHSTS